MKAADVIQVAIPGLRHHRRCGLAESLLRPLLNSGIHLPDGVGVGNADGADHHPEVLQVGLPGELAITIQIEETAVNGSGAGATAR